MEVMRVKGLTPLMAGQTICRECLQSRSATAMEACGGHLVLATGQPCPLYPYRLGRRPPVRALRELCLECQSGSPSLVRECGAEDCVLYPYRMGRNPARARVGGRRSEVEERSHVSA
jgi:hypothetical protein